MPEFIVRVFLISLKTNNVFFTLNNLLSSLHGCGVLEVGVKFCSGKLVSKQFLSVHCDPKQGYH